MREICQYIDLKFLPCKSVCVLAKNREKGGVEREKGPKSVGGGQKSGKPLPFWMHISFVALRWAPTHLPMILALDLSMWPLSPLSLALVAAF